MLSAFRAGPRPRPWLRLRAALAAAGAAGTRATARPAAAAKPPGTIYRGAAYVVSGRTGQPLLRLVGDRATVDFGLFFVAGIGDVNGDFRPDLYVADFSAGPGGNGEGRAYVFSGRTGRVLHRFIGDQPGDGLGPGRSAGDVDRDGRTGRLLRSYVSTNPGETLGFDAVGIGDVDDDGRADLVLTGAVANVVYVVGT